MISKIAGFEVRYHLFSPAFVGFFSIFFLCVFVAGTMDDNAFGAGGLININSPYNLTVCIVVFSTFGGIIPAAFLSSGVIRDLSYNCEELFYSRPIKEFDFVLGRFIGGFIVTALCFASVPLAFMIGSMMPWLDGELVGPTNLGWYLYLYATIGLANLWIVGTALFAVANFTRSHILVWVSLLGLLVLYFVGAIVGAQEPGQGGAMVLLDPFAADVFYEMTSYWTASESNTKVIPFDGLFLMNRLIWIGLGLVLLLASLFTFRFRKGRMASAFKKSRAEAVTGSQSTISDIDLPRVQPVLSGATTRQQFLARFGFEVKGIVLNIAFWLVLALGLALTLVLFFDSNSIYGTDTYPVTRVMMNSIDSAYTITPLIIVVFYAAELIWRERYYRFSEITEATPTPSWVFITSKFLALIVVIVSLAVIAVVAAVFLQLAMGYSAVEIDQYLIRTVVEVVIPFGLLAVLAIFLQVLLNNRWLGIIAIMVIILGRSFMRGIGFDHHLYNYGSTPAAPYSDMNGYGHFLGILLWFQLYWSFWALLLMVLTYQLWSRGSLTPIGTRLKNVFVSFTPATAGLVVISLVGAGLSGGWIFYNTNILNKYVSEPQWLTKIADYERTYGHLVDLPQPMITATSYEVEIYPEDRRYEAVGQYVMKNQTDAPIDTLWLSYNSSTTIVRHEMDGAIPVVMDTGMSIYSFKLEPMMQPGEMRILDFEVHNNNPGFRNSGNVTTVNYNGSFFNNFESMPQIGVNQKWFLQDRQQRRREGLEPLSRNNSLEDQHRWFESFVSQSAHFVDFRTEVCTAANQIAVAPGYLDREWTEQDTSGRERACFEYIMDSPIHNYYAWLSADYEVAEQEFDGINLQVFYHQPHDRNIERMIEASADSLRYFSQVYSPYQYRQFRILEFPSYQTFAQSFPNTIPYSEGAGFIADLSDPNDLDYVYYVTAHEAAHQWWGHQVMAANVQGATMLIESFAQYSALMVMRQEYGEHAMRRFLKYELDSYLGSRGNADTKEQPLYRVNNQQYIHYRKGAVIMYALQDYIGEETVNRALQRLIDERAFSSEPYATTLDFLRILREEAGPAWDNMITDFFERIILFDLSVTDATASQREDGRWDVLIDVEAHKYEADGEGQQTEESIDYPIDVGIFTRDLEGAIDGSDHVLYMQKHRVNENTMRFEFITDQRPEYVGIDPYNKLVDRNSDDNLRRVMIH